MGERRYICNRFPFLGIGRAKFENGLLVTSDPQIQMLVESNEWFNVHIHYQEIPTEPIAEPPPAVGGEGGGAEAPPSRVRVGRVGTKPGKEE